MKLEYETCFHLGQKAYFQRRTVSFRELYLVRFFFNGRKYEIYIESGQVEAEASKM